MRSNHVATVYLRGRGALNQVVPTTPGRQVKFFGGVAKVTDVRDMPRMLRMAGAQVEIEPDYASLLPEWQAACPPQNPPVADVLVVGAEPVAEEPPKKRGPKPKESGWVPPAPDELESLFS